MPRSTATLDCPFGGGSRRCSACRPAAAPRGWRRARRRVSPKSRRGATVDVTAVCEVRRKVLPVPVVDVSIVRIQNQLVILCHVKYLRVALGPLPTVTPHHLGTTGRTWVHACSVLCAPEHPSEFGVGQHIHPAFRVDLLQKPIETFALVLLANGNHLRDITRALARVRQELLHQVLVLFVHPHFDCTPLVLVGGGRPFPPAVLAHATPHVTDPRAAHKFNRPAALPYAEPNLDVLAAPV
mmetsp:Transcript_9226/g.23679  ORF Transcript_9226/g.23679 Transcript_9226/m.23679 type:complete len:240 (-) Transcript_9226:887-1606(-)